MIACQSQERLRAAVEAFMQPSMCLSDGSSPAPICSGTLWVAEACAQGRQSVAGYWEVNALLALSGLIVPFFERFQLVGTKAKDFERFRDAVAILSRGRLSDADDVSVLELREQMNGGGKRRYTMERILRDYTPSSFSPEPR